MSGNWSFDVIRTDDVSHKTFIAQYLCLLRAIDVVSEN